MGDNHIIIKTSIEEQFQNFMKQGKIFFVSAPCGFGKTSVVNVLTAGYSVYRLSAEKPDYEAVQRNEQWEILLVDDLQLMQEEDLAILCDLIRQQTSGRYVLLSRGMLPGCLMAFQYVGLMTVLRPEDLLFDRRDIRALFEEYDMPVTDSELSGIAKESIGYPLGVAITVQRMVNGAAFSSYLVSQVRHEVFCYFETAVYRRFDLPIRRFLLEMAPFEVFDTEMAHMVSGDPEAASLLEWLRQHTTMLRYDGVSQFHFWAQFRDFLLWEMEKEYTPEKRRALFGRGGIYYEWKEDYSHALECYTRSGDHSKVSELLIRGSQMHPGMGHYSEMDRYYRTLPDDEIKASPSLMQGMSMLCALSADYEKSEFWYEELKQFANSCDKQDAAGRQARSRLAWLVNISLALLLVVNCYG